MTVIFEEMWKNKHEIMLLNIGENVSNINFVAHALPGGLFSGVTRNSTRGIFFLARHLFHAHGCLS